MKKILLTGILALSVLMLGCEQKNATTETNGSAPQAGSKDIQIADLELGKIKQELISKVIECTGQIDIPPSDRASLYAPIGGVLGNIKIIPGTFVKKGQVLATLTHLDIIKIQQDYLRSKSTYQLAKQAYVRKKELYENEVTSVSEFQQVQSEYEIAKSDVEGLKAQLLFLGITDEYLQKNGIANKIYLRSPVTGYVTDVFVNTGMFVGVNEEVLTVINPGHKHVELDVFTKDVEAIEEEQVVHFRTTGSEKQYEAEILLIGQEVNEESRTVQVHAHLTGDYPGLVVGTHISADIFTAPDSVYCLPETAILNTGDGNVVLVSKAGSLNPQPVELGRKFEGIVEILNYSELLDAEVVLKDAYYFVE